MLAWVCTLESGAAFAIDPIPHGQDALPGKPLLPEQALEKMVVPDGFAVELVVAEPDLVNPVAMTIDERGRFWIAESVEYPRHSPGRGKDRIKILEDTDGDGTLDRNIVFADGLNIPSGIAIGHGGVWVANAPDILFYKLGPDDKRLGEPEVVVTGFGREDTHELPNSLTWGPDGWLYGLNGVFNTSVVKSNNGKTYEFTCAMFRIHPKTREFQIVCEGTSNPWGLAWDGEGSAFVSACVIDHLWHLVETGYYRRQAGAYPPFTWFIESIVNHQHQKAAYCGLHYFDSDAYPEQYRERLYMGNIHGACINVDRLERNGSTYFATGEADFLAAKDPWFMPVAQKTGPDGCLYVLDWYDRYHCYQDAQRDPPGIDRKYGRLYRIRYKDTPRARPFDLRQKTDDELIVQLASSNVYFRDLAQRLLCERMNPALELKLQSLILDDSVERKGRMHALWALVGAGRLDPQFHLKLLGSNDVAYRAWAVRAAGNTESVDAEIRNRIVGMATDPAEEVKLQLAIAVRKIDDFDAVPVLLEVLATSSGDKLIPHIVWQNLHPLIEDDPERFIMEIAKYKLIDSNPVAALLLRISKRLLALKDDSVVALYELLLRQEPSRSAVLQPHLAQLSRMIMDNEIPPVQRHLLARRLKSLLGYPHVREGALRFEATLLAAGLDLPDARTALLQECRLKLLDRADHQRGIEMLLAKNEPAAVELALQALGDKHASRDAKAAILVALRRSDENIVAERVLEAYPNLPPELQTSAIGLLTQRATWSKTLLKAICRGRLPPTVLNATQIAGLIARRDDELQRLIGEHWGSVRSERNPERQQIVNEMRQLIRSKQGDPLAGAVVFKNACAECHKIFGHGFDVGPDLTSNGRNDFEQLLSNVFDPSLVIGRAYQSVLVMTVDGRTFAGLMTEEGPDRVVLKLQGEKQEIIGRDEIDDLHRSELSLMPEGLEKQLKPQEVVDLFAFLALDKAPVGWPGFGSNQGAAK